MVSGGSVQHSSLREGGIDGGEDRKRVRRDGKYSFPNVQGNGKKGLREMVKTEERGETGS